MLDFTSLLMFFSLLTARLHRHTHTALTLPWVLINGTCSAAPQHQYQSTHLSVIHCLALNVETDSLPALLTLMVKLVSLEYLLRGSPVSPSSSCMYYCGKVLLCKLTVLDRGVCFNQILQPSSPLTASLSRKRTASYLPAIALVHLSFIHLHYPII